MIWKSVLWPRPSGFDKNGHTKNRTNELGGNRSEEHFVRKYRTNEPGAAASNDKLHQVQLFKINTAVSHEKLHVVHLFRTNIPDFPIFIEKNCTKCNCFFAPDRFPSKSLHKMQLLHRLGPIAAIAVLIVAQGATVSSVDPIFIQTVAKMPPAQHRGETPRKKFKSSTSIWGPLFLPLDDSPVSFRFVTIYRDTSLRHVSFRSMQRAVRAARPASSAVPVW